MTATPSCVPPSRPRWRSSWLANPDEPDPAHHGRTGHRSDPGLLAAGQGSHRALVGHPARPLDQGVAPAHITTLEQANAFLPGFMERYNARFAQPPQDPAAAWVPLPAELDRPYYFAICEMRKVGRDHCIRFAGGCWQLLPGPKDPSLVEQRISVHRVPEGELYLYHGKRRLAYQAFVAPPVAPPQPAKPSVASRRTGGAQEHGQATGLALRSALTWPAATTWRVVLDCRHLRGG